MLTRFMPLRPIKGIFANSVDAFRGVWSGSTLFALNTEISVTHGNNNKKQPDTPFIGKWISKELR